MGSNEETHPLYNNPRGIVLVFCETFDYLFMLCFAKSFGHRSQNNSPGCFVLCVRFPFNMGSSKHKSTLLGAFCFGGPEGNRTPVRKPLDMTFSVGSQFLLFPTTRRQLTGNAQSVAPLCLIGSGATTDASSPLR